MDRRAKNAEIFCDTEHRYKSDFELIFFVKSLVKDQAFICELEK